MVSTPEVFTDDSPISPMTSTQVKKSSAGKSLCLFTNILDVKNKTFTCRFVSARSKRKEIKYRTTPWALKQKRKGNSKINYQIKKSLYNWIMDHSQVVQSQIVDGCLKVNIDDHTELQLVPKLLLQVSVRVLHNRIVSDTEYGGLKEARDAENNIIISDSTLYLLLTTQFLKNSSRYKVMCGCHCCIFSKSIHSSLLSWRYRYFKNLIIKSKMLKTEGMGEK